MVYYNLDLFDLATQLYFYIFYIFGGRPSTTCQVSTSWRRVLCRMFNSDKGGTLIVIGRLDQKEGRKRANEMRRKIHFHLRTIILPVSSWCNWQK